VPGVCASTAPHLAAIRICSQADRPDEALDILWRVVRRSPATGLYPDVALYCAALNACVRTRRRDQAMAVFRHLQKQAPAFGVQADGYAYGLALSACRPEQASDLLDQGIAAGVVRPSLGWKPHSNIVNLHERHVLRDTGGLQRRHAIHPALARAVFMRLLHQGAIRTDTLFIVGNRGSGTVRLAIEQCMLEAGWVPTQPPVDLTSIHDARGTLTGGEAYACHGERSAAGPGFVPAPERFG